MEASHTQKLTDNFTYLTKNILITPTLLAHLISKGVLTLDLKEEITNEYRHPTTASKASVLLEKLFRRGPRAFPVLVEALVESDQGHVADMLDKPLAESYRAAPADGAGEANHVLHVPAVVPVGGAGGGDNGAPHPVAGDVNGVPKPAAGDVVDASGPEMKFNVQEASIESIKMALTERYPMYSTQRGRAIIVNVEKFKPGSKKSNRTGSSIDRNNLKKLCEQLGYTVVIWDNPTKEDFIERIKLEKANEEHSKADAFMMFIMSHGSKGVFYTVEGQSVNITQEVIDQFKGRNCQPLVGKPKMFFIQACQGSEKTCGVVPDGGAPAEPETKPDTDGSRDAFLKLATHEHADVLVTYSTVEGYESYRSPQDGSWFVRDLVKVFAASAHSLDVLKMVTRVSGLVDNHPEIEYKQVCATRGSLRKDIYLLPGFCDPINDS